jgi:nucleoside-specific outer membrane channel protein Tsx
MSTLSPQPTRTPSKISVGISIGRWFGLLVLLIGSGFAHAESVAIVTPDENGSDGKSMSEVTITPKEKGFINWMDNSISLLPYGWGFVVGPSEQSTFTFEHVHNSAIGDLFFFFDLTQFHNTTEGDDWTWYGEVSPRLSLGKILGKDLSWTPLRPSLFAVKDVLIAAQYERGRDPDEAQAVLVGLGFDLDVRDLGFKGPLGKFNFIQLNLYARSELTDTAQNGFRDMQVTMAASYPFNIGRALFLFDGYFDWVLGINSENQSFHINPQFKLDVGNFWGKPKVLYVGVEADFWWNKYQIPNSSAFDTNQSAVSLIARWHF